MMVGTPGVNAVKPVQESLFLLREIVLGQNSSWNRTGGINPLIAEQLNLTQEMQIG
jgi:hypothetical protein